MKENTAQAQTQTADVIPLNRSRGRTPNPYGVNGQLIREDDRRALQARLRDQLDAPAIVDDIRRIASWVRTGWVPEYVAPSVTPGEWQAYLEDPDGHPELAERIPSPTDYAPITPLILKRLQLIMDADFKLLSKVLPDMKSVEVEDTTPARARSLTDLQLAARVATLLSPLQPDSLGQPDPADPADPASLPGPSTFPEDNTPSWM